MHYILCRAAVFLTININDPFIHTTLIVALFSLGGVLDDLTWLSIAVTLVWDGQ